MRGGCFNRALGEEEGFGRDRRACERHRRCVDEEGERILDRGHREGEVDRIGHRILHRTLHRIHRVLPVVEVAHSRRNHHIHHEEEVARQRLPDQTWVVVEGRLEQGQLSACFLAGQDLRSCPKHAPYRLGLSTRGYPLLAERDRRQRMRSVHTLVQCPSSPANWC